MRRIKSSWHRIETVPSPWMASRKSPDGQPYSARCTMTLKRLDRVDRARRMKPATAPENRREHNLIDANKREKQTGDC